ncbi:TetR/AcrR family transcriptional regulator [Streptomyces sp. x-19]|uniref:TetR/AcrR family transcriptional regulator n=1 Tax=Streptomyces sp. x-19 TaxID=2789280 RepID=UPI00397FAF95
MTGRTTRRRGGELERAIFEAVWTELAEHGYAGLTMDGVAARAQTSKPVLYRRWSNRAELVVAALRRNRPAEEELPDTGNLRTDLLTYLRRLAHRFDDLPGGAVHGFLVDMLRDPELRQRFRSQLTQEEPVRGVTAMMRRAADRGDIDGDRLTPRVFSLPVDLLREEFLVQGVAPADDVVEEILDDIVLPLLRASEIRRTGPKQP